MATIHEQIAADAGGRWWWLSCAVCSAAHTITKTQCALYLATGWPACCGYTMTLSRERT